MSLLRILLPLIAPTLLGLTPASAQQAHRPHPGSTERTQILDAIRPTAGSNIRFIVHELRVIPGKTAIYAYAMVEPSKQEYDGGEFLLKNTSGWRVIWSVTGGGTDDCSTAADYYASAFALLTREGIDPDALNPQLQEEHLRLKTLAAEDPDCTAIGDLGPELISGWKQDEPEAMAQARPRILVHPRFPAPVTSADLDGDGKPDTISIMSILSSGAGRVIAADVAVANPWDTADPAQVLPDEEQPMALLVQSSRSGIRYLLQSPYIELSAGLRGGAPIEAQSAKSRLARAFRKDCPAMRHDFLLMATEAGIDIALFWNAGHYEVCWPDEIP
ncbi:MAG: hypothetical protein AB7G25_01030 [Sphingomonadaceae bacterium]